MATTYAEQMQQRLGAYLEAVADWANVVNIDREPGGQFPNF
jgi:hypothetical protein